MINKSKDAIKMMKSLLAETDDVGVFVNKGWADTVMKVEYSIIRDGDGQNPLERISEEVFEQLKQKNYLGPNILNTYKARRFHAFKGAIGYEGPAQHTNLPERK